MHMGFFQPFSCSKLAPNLSGRKLQQQKNCHDGKQSYSKQLPVQTSEHISTITSEYPWQSMSWYSWNNSEPINAWRKGKTTDNCKKSQQTPSKYLPVTVSWTFRSSGEKTATPFELNLFYLLYTTVVHTEFFVTKQ